jgi:hypothetical protein
LSSVADDHSVVFIVLVVVVLVVVFAATSSSFPLPSSSPSLSLSLLPLSTSLRAVVPMAIVRRAGPGCRTRATQLASSWPRRLSLRRRPSLFVFVVVAVAVADVLACHPPCGEGEAGGAGAMAAHDAVGLLMALGIVVTAPAFALALWMPSTFCSKMALLVLALLTVLVLVLALTQLGDRKGQECSRHRQSQMGGGGGTWLSMCRYHGGGVRKCVSTKSKREESMNSQHSRKRTERLRNLLCVVWRNGGILKNY